MKINDLNLSTWRYLIAFTLLLFASYLFCLQRVEALSCAVQFTWRNFEHTDVDADPAKGKEDAEARAALAMMKPIVFRGRVARARYLFNSNTTGEPITLIVFKDVEVLKGELPQSAGNRKAIIVHYGWCDLRCAPASEVWPRGQTFAFGVRPFRGEVKFGKIIYKGRVDAEISACDYRFLTRLEWHLLNAPDDEIARLEREYPFHPIRK